MKTPYTPRRVKDPSRKPGKCCIFRCRHPARPGRSLCYRHEKYIWRHRYPYAAAYADLRWSAQRRNLEFTLTYEQYVKMLFDFDFRYGTRRHAAGLCIDRIDNSKGYTLQNVQVITLSANSSKGTSQPEPDPF